MAAMAIDKKPGVKIVKCAGNRTNAHNVRCGAGLGVDIVIGLKRI
jgi:hypothetical protein